MKFGDALPLRSVQEWLPYNIDYTDIKQLIKRYTTQKPPVTSPDQKTDFEDELFEVLLDQLGRIDLFVKSKTGEIDRRTASCERQVIELQKRTPTARTAPKIVNRYAKIEREIERVGHDVQLLSRFVNVQRTGFHKLLKKYRKWTGSDRLPDRFFIILESPTAFHRHDFDQNVIEVSELLTAVRDGIDSLSEAVFSAPSWPNSDCETSPATTRPSTSHSGYKNPGRIFGTRLELDTAFATSLIAGHGGRAVFWVHNDYLIELQVFLLKYLSPHNSTPQPSMPSTPRIPSTPRVLSRRSSMSNFGMQVKGEEVGFAALENLANLSDGHNSATFDTFSKSAMRTAGQIRWCARDPEVFVVVTDHVGSVTNGNRGTESLEVRIMRTQVESLIDPKMDSPKLPSDQSALQRQTVKKMREWFKSQAGVAPLVKILSRRTRYKRSMPDCETWAYLDRDIRMMPNSGHAGWLTSEDEECDNTAEFPHAVLEIQWDGNTPGFIDELSQSYMVESVPNFSLDIHAIAVLHKPRNMAPPYWLSALKRDIRKAPPVRPTMHSRRNSSRVVFSNSSSKNPSTVTHTSSGQYDQYSTPATSDGGALVFQKERRRKPRNEIKSLGNKRYWNEFDDEDTPEPYTILVRPSTPNADGEMEEDSTLSEFLCSPIAEVFSRLCGRREKARHSDEYTPLIGRLDSDSETETDARVRPLPNHSDYDTFGGPVVRRETNEYSGSHMIFLAISFFMLIVTGSIAVGESLSGHKHKHRNFGKLVVIDLSVFVGILISLISGVIGVTIFLVGRTRASWLHRVTVWGVFAGMCAGCGVILTVASRDIIDKAA